MMGYHTFIIVIHDCIRALHWFELEHIILINEVNIHFTGQCPIINQNQGYCLRVVDQVLLEQHQSLTPLVPHCGFLDVDPGKISIPRHLKHQVLPSSLICGHTLNGSLKYSIKSLEARQFSPLKKHVSQTTTYQINISVGRRPEI